MATPSVDDVDRIASLADPVLRNLQITQCYHELSSAFAQVVVGANWCTFATWASKQAGASIRREDLARAFEDLVGAVPEIPALLEVVAQAGAGAAPRRQVEDIYDAVRRGLNPAVALAHVSAAVARGNRKVFEEIGREVARFLATVMPTATVDPARLQRFCGALRLGDPPGGQQFLIEAFTAYAEAVGHADAKAKAELVFLGNLLIGLHEQTRLQPEIEDALNTAARLVDELKPRLVAIVLPSAWLRIRRVVARLLGRRLPLDVALDGLIEHVRRQMRQLTTRSLMVLRLPRGEVLRLGGDLPAEFPPALQAMTNARAQHLLQRIDLTPDSVAGTGVGDWANLSQRVHFIADFFRAWHERPELFDAPFSPAQTAALKAGRVPEGRF